VFYHGQDVSLGSVEQVDCEEDFSAPVPNESAPSAEGLPAQRGVRVHHLEVEERTVIGERRRNVAERFEGDGTVQLGVGDHARREGAVGKVAAPVVLVAPRDELPAQGCRCGRFDAFRADLIGGEPNMPEV
jgi:hypothetical protein